MLSKQEDTKNVTYLEVKHLCLWVPLKEQAKGCDVVEVNNPSTNKMVTKYGYKYRAVEGLAIKMEKYDTGKQYPTRFFGFKLHLLGVNGEQCVLDMPYKSQVFRRFLRTADNMDFMKPLNITVFKGQDKKGKDEACIWFKQEGQTVRQYFTKDTPHGMPEAVYDDIEEKLDFRAQHSWLVKRMQEQIIPLIAAAGERFSGDVTPSSGSMLEQPVPFEHAIQDLKAQPPAPTPADPMEINDDDVPF